MSEGLSLVHIVITQQEVHQIVAVLIGAERTLATVSCIITAQFGAVAKVLLWGKDQLLLSSEWGEEGLNLFLSSSWLYSIQVSPSLGWVVWAQTGETCSLQWTDSVQTIKETVRILIRTKDMNALHKVLGVLLIQESLDHLQMEPSTYGCQSVVVDEYIRQWLVQGITNGLPCDLQCLIETGTSTLIDRGELVVIRL